MNTNTFLPILEWTFSVDVKPLIYLNPRIYFY